MKKAVYLFTVLSVSIIMFSCTKKTKTGQQTAKTEKATENKPKTASRQILEGDYCFLKAENKDSTEVHLRIINNGDIKGEMTWQPWEKDGAAGILSGRLISENEMELLYDYTIEGSRQTETKIMKIENDRLYIKTGELTDPKNDGNLIYKDLSKATYSEILEKVSCK